MQRFAVSSVLVLVALFAVSVSALPEKNASYMHPPSTSSFSAPEQALLGSSYAEDCIFGSSSSVFRFTPDEVDDEQVLQVKNTVETGAAAATTEPNSLEETTTSKTTGFRRPTFRRRR